MREGRCRVEEEAARRETREVAKPRRMMKRTTKEWVEVRFMVGWEGF